MKKKAKDIRKMMTRDRSEELLMGDVSDVRAWKRYSKDSELSGTKKKTKFEKRRCCPKDAAKVGDGIDIPFRFENKKYNRQMARESEESWRN